MADSDALLIAEQMLIDEILADPTGEGPMPEWATQLNQRLLLALIDDPDGDALAHRLGGIAQQAPQGWLVALKADESSVREHVKTLRSALHPKKGRAVVAFGEGAFGREALLGPVVDHLTTLHHSTTERGLIVDQATFALFGELGVAAGDGFLLRSTQKNTKAASTRTRAWPWIAAAAAVVITGVTWLHQPATSVGPEGWIYVVGSPARVERGPEPLRTADHVTVMVEGSKDSYCTLLLLDSDNHISTPAPKLINALSSRTVEQRTSRFEFDDQPGLERFMVLVTHTPINDLPTLLEAINTDVSTRSTQVKRLHNALKTQISAPYQLREAAEIEHGR